MANLPPDLQKLMDIRDELGDYLATIERNTDAVNQWLLDNKSKIVLFHQKLERALNTKNEATAIALIGEMGEIAGFVLSIQDFKTKGEAAFGANSKFHVAISSFKNMLPEFLLEDVPSVSLPDGTSLQMEYVPPPPAAPQEPEKKSVWSASTDWFTGNSEKEAKRRAEEEKQRHQQLHGQFRDVKAEILGLQSDRHYYIDSLMEWVADTLAPELIGFDPEGSIDGIDMDATLRDIAKKPLQYQNPSYIIRLAQEDFKEASEVKALKIRQAALEYSQIANAVDRQDIDAITKTLGLAYPANPTDESLRLKELLLNDYKSLGLAEFIMTNIQSRTHQEYLFRMYEHVIHAEPLQFADAGSPAKIFEKFVNLTLDKENWLHPAVLWNVMLILQNKHNMTENDFIRSTGADGKQIFERVMDRYPGDKTAQKSVLGYILKAMGKDDGYLPSQTVDLAYALDSQNKRNDLWEVFSRIRSQNSAQEILPLLMLCRPKTKLLQEILTLPLPIAQRSKLMADAIQTGLLDNLRTDRAAFNAVIEQCAMHDLQNFPIDHARILIAHSFSLGGLLDLRQQATNNWLAKIVSSTVDENKKLEWIAALLEPFPSNITRANMLYAAAQKLPKGSAAAETLLSLEKNLVGDNIQLPNGNLLCNIDKIGRLVYEGSTRTLSSATKEQSNPVITDLSPEMAADIICLAARRGDFLEETYGLMRPENIEILEVSNDSAKAHWYNQSPQDAKLTPASVAAFKKRTDFLHLDTEDGRSISFNLRNVCLIQKLEGGKTLLVMEHGSCYKIDGDIPYHANPYVLDLNDDVKINLSLAGLIILNPGKNAFDFRCQSKEFLNLLVESGEQNEGVYNIQLGTPEAFDKLKDALSASADFYMPESTVYMNMPVLGFMSFYPKKPSQANDDDKADIFFTCKKYGRPEKVNDLEVSSDLAEHIFANLDKKPELIRVADTVLHVNSIDSIYYNAAQQLLDIAMGSTTHKIRDIDEVTASTVMTQLAKKRGFIVTAEMLLAGKRAPVDIANFARLTQIKENITYVKGQPEPGNAHAIALSMPFEIPSSGPELQELIDRIDNDGKFRAKHETKATAWTQQLEAAIQGLAPFNIRVSPVIDLTDKQVMLQQALGKVEPNNGATSLSQEFATVASLPVPNSTFTYPAQKKPKKQAPPSR